MKINRRTFRCQQKFKDSMVSLEIQHNPVEYSRENFTFTETHVLKQLFNFKQRRNIFRMSQGWLAKRLGVCRQYINTIMKKFESLGIITMWYHHKDTSHYRISSFFTDKIIASLSHLWRALPLTLLLSQTPVESTIQPTRQNINNNIIINNNVNTNTVNTNIETVSISTLILKHFKKELKTRELHSTLKDQPCIIPTPIAPSISTKRFYPMWLK